MSLRSLVPSNTLFASGRVGLLLALLLLLSACVGNPTKNPPVTQPPATWQTDNPQGPIQPAWLQDFASPRLEQLVQQAMLNSPELSASAARAQASLARARISAADRLPRADLTLQAGRAGDTQGSPQDSFSLQAGIEWNADLWGSLDNAARAAALEALASEQDYRSVRQRLAAQVTKGWFQAIEAGQQLSLAEGTRDSFRNSLEVIEELYRRGLNSALDVRLARSDLAASLANLAARQRELDASLRSLEGLLGAYPMADLRPNTELPRMAPQVPAGLPAQLLARRPDLIAAEQRLSAAGERLDQAKKNRLPSLRLTARGGSASDELRQLLDWDHLVWSLLGGLTQPLFEGGRLEAEQLLAQAQHREAWADYARVALQAFREVETSLAAESNYQAQETALYQASGEAREAENLAAARYRQGLENITTLLEARRRAFNAQSTWLRIARQRLENRVDLYLALGGAFAPDDANNSEQQP